MKQTKLSEDTRINTGNINGSKEDLQCSLGGPEHPVTDNRKQIYARLLSYPTWLTLIVADRLYCTQTLQTLTVKALLNVENAMKQCDRQAMASQYVDRKVAALRSNKSDSLDVLIELTGCKVAAAEQIHASEAFTLSVAAPRMQSVPMQGAPANVLEGHHYPFLIKPTSDVAVTKVVLVEESEYRTSENDKTLEHTVLPSSCSTQSEVMNRAAVEPKLSLGEAISQMSSTPFNLETENTAWDYSKAQKRKNIVSMLYVAAVAAGFIVGILIYRA